LIFKENNIDDIYFQPNLGEPGFKEKACYISRDKTRNHSTCSIKQKVNSFIITDKDLDDKADQYAKEYSLRIGFFGQKTQ
jgi:hypothetical protein